MPKENKYRLKIILTKHTAEEPLEDTDIIKFEEEELDENVDVMKLSVDNTITLFYRQQGGFSPKWYKDYLLEKDKKLKNSYSQGIFFKKIEYEGKEYKFAISFGGAETLLNPEHVEPRFGLIVALNLAESIYSLKKNTISDTMSKVREDALKGQEI